MPVGIYNHASAMLPVFPLSVFVCGGRDMTCKGGSERRECYAYSAMTNEWAAVANMSTQRQLHRMVQQDSWQSLCTLFSLLNVFLDQFYIMGGATLNSARTIEAYNVLHGGVILKPDLALNAMNFAAVVINP
jgi:hypothetical protein